MPRMCTSYKIVGKVNEEENGVGSHKFLVIKFNTENHDLNSS